MNEIEKAIAELQSRAGRTLKTALSAETAKLAVEALGEKAEREEMQIECDYCNTNPCWCCEYAGECKAWVHCKSNNRDDYKARQNFCHVCGRKLEIDSYGVEGKDGEYDG